MELENRITDLEIRLAYLENTLQTLDAIIIEQNSMIDKLRKSVVGLEAQAKELSNSSIKPLNEEAPPPHY